jgi:hypothetical protein
LPTRLSSFTVQDGGSFSCALPAPIRLQNALEIHPLGVLQTRVRKAIVFRILVRLKISRMEILRPRTLYGPRVRA